ncbi:MAG: DUF3300 domain-containing protein [Steroidobacteraceae bacterium]
MFVPLKDRRPPATFVVLATALALAGCGKKEPPAASAPPALPAESTVAAAPAPAAAPIEAVPAVVSAEPPAPAAWTPEALEELLAPIALYPDPVLSQVLIAATNPQEVLDAGNWLIENDGLDGKSLDDAAAKIGFTPPVRALLQFPQTVDLMCMEMGWTTELGQAFIADQAGVLDAVQRLRTQAKNVGNLQSSAAMKVETEMQEDKEVIVLKPPKPEVVYVPTYDPQTAYAPPPATAMAPATTETATVPTTMTPVEDKTKYDKGDMITTGVLAFGAGILVNELFDDDDNDNRHSYYYPNYGYGGMPYYPPYPYRPSYGGGYYPSNGYNRPPNYNNGYNRPNYNNGGFQNNGNIVINTGGGNGYWDRYDNQRSGSLNNNGYRQPRGGSPITAAKKDRPELAQLDQRKPRPMPADYKRPNPDATASNWKSQSNSKGQSGYKGSSSYKGRDGKSGGASRDPATRIADASPGYSGGAPANRAGTKDRPAPKVQGSYAGGNGAQRPAASKATPTSRDVQKTSGGKATPNSRDMQKPSGGKATPNVQKPQNMGGDRGYGTTNNAQRPSGGKQPASNMQKPAGATPASANANRGGGGSSRPTAVSGAQGGGNDRAASQRGKQSMPKGPPKGGGGGNGGGKKKQGR